MRIFYLILLGSLLVRCSGDENACRSVPSLDNTVEITIERTEDVLFGAGGPEDIRSYLESYPQVARHFLFKDSYPNDSVLVHQLWQTVSHPSADTVYQETKEAFPDLGGLSSDLQEGFSRLRLVVPDIKTPQVYTVVTGLYNDLFVSDSLIIIGLDHFIGEDATFKPNDIPMYILERYDREHLAAIIMQFISANLVFAGDQNTMLSDMIDFGKTYYLTGQLLPCTADSILFGYTPREVAGIDANRERIWAHFVDNRLLYETEHFKKKKYIGDRPNVYEIGDECPGRIATWIGYEIVQAFMSNNQISLKELIEWKDHHKLFEQSGYKPRNTIP